MTVVMGAVNVQKTGMVTDIDTMELSRTVHALPEKWSVISG